MKHIKEYNQFINESLNGESFNKLMNKRFGNLMTLDDQESSSLLKFIKKINPNITEEYLKSLFKYVGNTSTIGDKKPDEKDMKIVGEIESYYGI